MGTRRLAWGRLRLGAGPAAAGRSRAPGRTRRVECARGHQSGAPGRRAWRRGARRRPAEEGCCRIRRRVHQPGGPEGTQDREDALTRTGVAASPGRRGGWEDARREMWRRGSLPLVPRRPDRGPRSARGVVGDRGGRRRVRVAHRAVSGRHPAQAVQGAACRVVLVHPLRDDGHHQLPGYGSSANGRASRSSLAPRLGQRGAAWPPGQRTVLILIEWRALIETQNRGGAGTPAKQCWHVPQQWPWRRVSALAPAPPQFPLFPPAPSPEPGLHRVIVARLNP